MKTHIYHRKDCSRAEGLCIVIDVLRAFTTAAFAFAGGAKEIVLVSTIEDAFQRRKKDNSLILMGEEEGNFIPGFHFGNSPAEICDAAISGRRVIQRTSSGTQGVFACAHAKQMLVASFVVAEATLRRILQLNPSHVSFIVTGRNNGDEDLAFAEYLECRILGKDVQVDSFLERVKLSRAAHRMLSADKSEYPYGERDLEMAIEVNRFPFAMEVNRQNESWVAKPFFI